MSEREAELRYRIVSVKSLCGLHESFSQTSDFDELQRRGTFAWINGVLFFQPILGNFTRRSVVAMLSSLFPGQARETERMTGYNYEPKQIFSWSSIVHVTCNSV